MQRIGDRNFLFAWQAIRAASQPGPECMAWQVGTVSCRRSRHSLAQADYTVVLDVVLVSSPAAEGTWSVMVTTENWWDNRHRPVRSQVWASHLGGPREAVLSWFRIQAASKEPGMT